MVGQHLKDWSVVYWSAPTFVTDMDGFSHVCKRLPNTDVNVRDARKHDVCICASRIKVYAKDGDKAELYNIQTKKEKTKI